MSFGVTIAIEKLKKNDIFCISPPKIIMSGRINAVCFDKTGTLTHEGVILRGIVEK
jgi:cation-transporting ATPase 13A2